jgi:hypothetical protein
MKAIQASFVAIVLTLLINSTQAAVFCVDTNAELQQAFMTAASNSEDDTVKIETGTYEGSSAVAFAYSTNQNFALTVSGGYLPACALQLLQPSLTVLSGSDARQVLQLFGSTGTSGGISLSNLTIRDGFSSQQGAGLFIGGGGSYSGNVSVSRVIIERNTSTAIGGGMAVFSDGGIVNVVNNLFLLNRCGTSNCAISATVNATSATNHRAFFGNNSIVFNQCSAGSSCSETGARFGGSARAAFYNNVFAGNSNGDLNLLSLGSGSVDLYNNNLVSRTGTAPTIVSGNIAFANPQFIDVLNDDFRPSFTSPLRNAGTSLFALLSIDLIGESRVNEFRVDIGAYENSDLIFENQFDLVL